jgi:hypothetical protein
MIFSYTFILVCLSVRSFPCSCFIHYLSFFPFTLRPTPLVCVDTYVQDWCMCQTRKVLCVATHLLCLSRISRKPKALCRRDGIDWWSLDLRTGFEWVTVSTVVCLLDGSNCDGTTCRCRQLWPSFFLTNPHTGKNRLCLTSDRYTRPMVKSVQCTETVTRGHWTFAIVTRIWFLSRLQTGIVRGSDHSGHFVVRGTIILKCSIEL